MPNIQPTEHVAHFAAASKTCLSFRQVCLGTSHLHEIVALTTYVCPLTRAERCRYLLPAFILLPDMLGQTVVKTETRRVIN